VTAPNAVPLTGADCFLRAFDDEIRRKCGASHVSQLVLRLGPGFDVEIFRKLVDEAARAQPMLRAPIRRPFGVGAPVYRLDAAAERPIPEVTVRDVADPAAAEGPLPESFAARLNEPLDARRGRLLRFDAVRYDGGTAGTDLAASWLHMLFDGSGSELFMGWLDACFRGDASPSVLPCPDELAPPEPASLTLGQRGEAARSWQQWLAGLRGHPPQSLAGPLRRGPQRLGYDLHTLSPEDTAGVVETAKARAGFLTPMLYYLAAAIRAHHAVFRERGVRPASYVVPLPVNLRPKGAAKAIFRTHVSLVWFQALAEEVDDFDALLDRLKEQRVAAIKARQIENGVHAMGFAKYAPKRAYTHMARRDFAGELCSFFFAFTGEFMAGLDHFVGAPIRNGFHVAPVPPSPGSCLAMSLFGDRLNATHIRQGGVFSARELEIFRDQLLSDLRG